jgi:hypothetical protein
LGLPETLRPLQVDDFLSNLELCLNPSSLKGDLGGIICTGGNITHPEVGLATIDFVWTAIVVVAASFIHGFSGFGFALVAVPLLSLQMPLQFILPMTLMLTLVIGGILTADKWHRFHDPTLYIILFGMMIGAYGGTRILMTVPESFLKTMLAIGILAHAARMSLRRGPQRYRERGARVMAGSAGLAGGTLGGMFGTSGPPLVMYLNAYAPGDKSDFRARILVLLLIENLWRGVLYIREGLFTGPILSAWLLLLPLLVFGMWAGSHVHYRVSDAVFQRVIASLLAFSGTLLLFR